MMPKECHDIVAKLIEDAHWQALAGLWLDF